MRWTLVLACAVGAHAKHGCSNHHGCGDEVKVLNTGDILPDGSAPIPDGRVPFHEHDLVNVSSPARTTGNKSTAASTSNTSTLEPPLSEGKKCLDASGEAVWCSSSTSIVDSSESIKEMEKKTPKMEKSTTEMEKSLEKKCLDANGEAVWCSSAYASVVDIPSDAGQASQANQASQASQASQVSQASARSKNLTEAPEKRCLDETGAPTWCPPRNVP